MAKKYKNYIYCIFGDNTENTKFAKVLNLEKGI